VYTVTVICGTAPLQLALTTLHWDWQLLWYCISLRFSDPRALKIPGVPRRASGGSGNRHRRICGLRPTLGVLVPVGVCRCSKHYT